MRLQYLNNAALLSVMTSSMQSACNQLVDFTVGSVLRAIVQANASVALWIQWLIGRVLLTTRAATSTGADLDSWVADYGLNRLPAISSHGTITLSRNSTTTVLQVPTGGTVRTSDGTQSFVIGADTMSAAWNAQAACFVMAQGVASIDVPITATIAGMGGNVQSGAISLIVSAIPGVDSVTNNVPTTGGLDAESDLALRQRATLFFASLSRGTLMAVLAAATSVQQGLQIGVVENSPQAGQFVVVADDGSGNPPASLLSAIYAAVDAIRPIGSVFTVIAPSTVSATISINLTTTGIVNRPALIAALESAVAAMVNSLQIGVTLSTSRIAALAYNQSSAISGVAVTINNSSDDLVPQVNGVVRLGSVTVA